MPFVFDGVEEIKWSFVLSKLIDATAVGSVLLPIFLQTRR